MKYFTIEQVVEALKTGAARRHQIYDNFAQARYRGFTERQHFLKLHLRFSINGKRRIKNHEHSF